MGSEEHGASGVAVAVDIFELGGEEGALPTERLRAVEDTAEDICKAASVRSSSVVALG